MILYIDHFDSFSALIIDYFKQLQQQVTAIKTNECDKLAQLDLNKITHIIIGPGPGHPDELKHLYPFIQQVIDNNIPLLGICLGHQLLAQYFGGKVIHAQQIMHGRVSKIQCQNTHPIYTGLPQQHLVTRYHSLIIDENTLPKQIKVIAISNENEIMAISHNSYRIFGVQYHPEAHLTEAGLTLLKNFISYPR